MRVSALPRGLKALTVPVVTVAAVAAGSIALGGLHPDAAFASQHPNLPARTPLQLLTAAQTTKTDALSGTVTESAHWGLPSLPGGSDAASLNWQGLLTGSHTVRVAVAGPTRQRLAVLGSLSESDVVRNGNDVWTYTSTDNSVTHSVLPAASARTAHHPGAADDPAATLTPQGAAQQLLDGLDPSTTVSVDATQRVAGRSAYTLVLTPKDSRSTVRRVEIALDSQHFIPLRVQLFGAGSTPAFETGFTQISFATPSAATFQFHAPAGSSTATDPFGFGSSQTHAHPGQDVAGNARPTVLGTGWASVIEIPASAIPAGTGGSSAAPRHSTDSATGLLNSLTAPYGSTGDRLLHTSVVNALMTADGRIFVGAVSPALLQEAAAGTYK
jgi:outer membrane lipoprotein-sorting protein